MTKFFQAEASGLASFVALTVFAALIIVAAAIGAGA